MHKDSKKGLGRVIQIDEAQVRGHLDEMVCSTVEETLNGLYKFSNYPTLGISGDSDYAASAAALSSSFGIIGGSFLRPSASRNA